MCCCYVGVAGYKKAQSIRSVVDSQQLPVSVQFDNPVFSSKLRLATVRALHGTSSGLLALPLDNDGPPLCAHGALKFVRQYAETFYVINHVINGQLS